MVAGLRRLNLLEDGNAYTQLESHGARLKACASQRPLKLPWPSSASGGMITPFFLSRRTDAAIRCP